MAARKTDYVGDRFGDWFVESKATPLDGKRRWHCVNTMTDERRLVLQTELKNLTSETEDDVPTSAQITAKVLVHNFKDDPFNLPDGVLPDDDDEYPFEPVFREPAITDLDSTSDEGSEENPFEAAVEDDDEVPSLNGQILVSPWEPQPIEDSPTVGMFEQPYGFSKEYKAAIAHLAEGYAMLRDALA